MIRKSPKDKSLAHLNPELAKEWHSTKNGDLTPFNVSVGTYKKVWWKCDKGDDHEWEASISKRSNGNKCPICSGHKVVKSNCLATTNPQLSKEWHPTKNGNLTSFDVVSGSKKKVWWKCPKGEDHEYESRISSRSNGIGCPICNGRKTVLSNCLATTNPQLSKEWHPTKNGNLTSFDVVSGSKKKVWWKCPKGEDHEWLALISNRSRGIGCPLCSGQKVVKSNSLATKNPKLSKEWHPTKNGLLTPNDVTIGSGKKVWWKCTNGIDHEWISTVSDRKRGQGCPICSGHKTSLSSSIFRTHPNLIKEWHTLKNGELSPQLFSKGSSKKVWWKCDKGEDHEWYVSINMRARGYNCPVCSGQKIVKSNCLATTNPQLSKEWHPTKNGLLTPNDVTIGSGKKVWWKCPNGEDHEWKSSINSRNKGNTCPVCSGKKVVKSNCLATKNPKLSKEWHPTKNGLLTPNDVTIGSGKKVWWKCPNGEDHEWKTRISARAAIKTRNSNCPYCVLTPQSKQELTITFELKQFFTINPKGFKTRVNRKMMSIDIYISELNLGIEFDGSYWHKGKRELDKLKTVQLIDVGFNIIRVRQEPLKQIFDSDVIASKNFDGKIVTNDILKQILKDYPLTIKIMKKIKKYLSLDSLQNEKKLNKYIDMILEERRTK